MRFFHSPKKNQCHFRLTIVMALVFFCQHARSAADGMAIECPNDGSSPITIDPLFSCHGLQITNPETKSVVNDGVIYATGDNGEGGGTASGGAVVIAIPLLTTFINNGTITSANTDVGTTGTAFFNHPSGLNIGSIFNNNLIEGGSNIGISNSDTTSIDNIINSTNATISGTYGIFNDGIITSITNIGSIFSGIYNNGGPGSIETLNNLQNVNNPAGALAYSVVLPTNYNIIINNTTSYGQLAVTSGTGNMAFGIYGGAIGFVPVTYPNSIGGDSQIAASIVANNTKYANVLQGLVGTLSGSTITGNESVFTILGATGSYGGYSYALAQNGSSELGNWDLFFGASTADTQASLNTQSRRLRSAFNSTMASANFANMNTYDCNLFDQNNMCISVGGRYTNIDNPSSNNSAAIVTLGYKVSPNIRIGGFLDQSVNNNTPTGIQVSNKNPMMGAFAVWNQNANGLGYQLKIANAYQDKDVRSTRDAYGDTGEAGTGKTNLNTQSYVGELSYAFNYQDSTIVRPYFAVRYTNIKQDAYTEDTSASVTAPLTYAKLGDRSTTALMGVKLNHALTPRTNLTASLGVEQDINHKTDQLTASGVADLTSENFNNNIKRTRPVASAGAYYAVAKNQRLSGEVYYQQLPFQSTGSATAYVNYMIGF